MKIKKLLCITTLMLMLFLVGCKEEKKLDVADLQCNWTFDELDYAGQVLTHTPGLESKEPGVSFDGEDIIFKFNGKTSYGVVEAGTESYNVTFPDGSRKPMVAKLSDGGNTLMLTIEGLDFDIKFKKQ